MAFSSVKIVVLAPIPRARESTAARAKPRFLLSPRRPQRRSSRSPFMTGEERESSVHDNTYQTVILAFRDLANAAVGYLRDVNRLLRAAARCLCRTPTALPRPRPRPRRPVGLRYHGRP